MIKEALSLIRSTFPAMIEVRQRISSEVGTIFADANQIHQVVMNLGTNALQAMGNGPGILEVSLDDIMIDEEEAAGLGDIKAGPHVGLTMSDTGHGIEADVLTSIFDPFFTTRDIGQGTGLGLSVVYGIVRSHGGSVTAQSVPGEGAEFRVLFPTVSTPQTTDAGELPHHEGMPLGRERILVVDDVPAIVDILKQQLEPLGYDVTALSSGVDALELFRGAPGAFELVLTDQAMPDLSGLDLAVELQAARADIPIILSTGFPNVEIEARVRDGGISKVLTKPYSKAELARAVREVLDEARPEARE